MVALRARVQVLEGIETTAPPGTVTVSLGTSEEYTAVPVAGGRGGSPPGDSEFGS